jgi:hypothetical protein
MSNKRLAILGIGLYILRVLSSATDLEGNQQAPTVLILISGIGTLIFIVLVVMRLWNVAKITALMLAFFAVLSLGTPLIATPELSVINILVSGIGIAFFVSYFYTVFLLWDLPSSVTKNEPT